MITFSETEEKLSIEKIEEIQNYSTLILPEDYKEHLLNYNGGRCVPNVFDFNERGKITSSNIDWFLAIYDGKYDNLKKYIEIYKIEEKRVPNHILPFAHDSGGNLICISCGPNDFGYVFFWDHEKEVDYNVSSDDDYSNLYLVANSFKDFLESLRYPNVADM